jgi:hypothetical protein
MALALAVCREVKGSTHAGADQGRDIHLALGAECQELQQRAGEGIRRCALDEREGYQVLLPWDQCLRYGEPALAVLALEEDDGDLGV